MLWWFERKGDRIRVEVRRAPSGECDLSFVDEYGTYRIEHFADVAVLAKRQQEVEHALVALGWVQSEIVLG